MDFTIKHIQRNKDFSAEITGNTYDEYYWVRRAAEYIFRLMYAVTVDRVLVKDSSAVNNALMGVRTGTVGSYVASARSNLIGSLEKGPRGQFGRCWNILYELTTMRNFDAHQGTPPGELQKYILAIEEKIRELEKASESRFFSFSMNKPTWYDYVLVSPNAHEDQNGELRCVKINKNGDFEQIGVPCACLARGKDQIKGQLYLAVSTGEGVEYYRLSPFIGLDNAKLESPTMFMGIVQLWSREISVEHVRILDDRENAENLYSACVLESLVPQGQDENSKFRKISSLKKNRLIEINLSEYPGYNKIPNSSTLPYCKEICPVVDETEKFCRNRRDYNESYRIICGDGGLGKTALIFHLIHDVILQGETEFTRVIFLSAKKYFRYTDKSFEDREQEGAITPDIRSHQEFLKKMKEYLYEENVGEEEIDEKLLDRINGKAAGVSIPCTFLVVDDLDTLPKEDQEKIIGFLNGIKTKKMKALVTTRDKGTNGQKISLTKLDQEHSLRFLKWDLEQKGYTRRNVENADVFYQYTEGRPLDIKLWSNLLRRGINVPDTFGTYWTKKQKTLYLYQTTLNQIEPLEKQLFSVLCGIHQGLEKKTDPGIEKTLLLCLFPWLGETDMEGMLKKLTDVRLIRTEGETVFLEEIDYQELLKLENIKVEGLPDHFQSIIKNIQEAPAEWSRYRYHGRLISYLTRRLSEGYRDYELGVLNRLNEQYPGIPNVSVLLERYGKDDTAESAPKEKMTDMPESKEQEKEKTTDMPMPEETSDRQEKEKTAGMPMPEKTPERQEKEKTTGMLMPEETPERQEKEKTAELPGSEETSEKDKETNASELLTELQKLKRELDELLLLVEERPKEKATVKAVWKVFEKYTEVSKKPKNEAEQQLLTQIIECFKANKLSEYLQ